MFTWKAVDEVHRRVEYQRKGVLSMQLIVLGYNVTSNGHTFYVPVGKLAKNVEEALDSYTFLDERQRKPLLCMEVGLKRLFKRGTPAARPQLVKAAAKPTGKARPMSVAA